MYPHHLKSIWGRIIAIAMIIVVALLGSGCMWRELVSRLPKQQATLRPQLGKLAAFSIADPYAVAGDWYKAQLHIHTASSIDSTWPVREAIRTYAAAGYDVIALTDHDVVTHVESPPDSLLMLPSEENTLPTHSPPLGLHAVFLGVGQHIEGRSVAERFEAVAGRGGIVMLAHPSWSGNLGTGRWEVWHALAAPEFHLVEIVNRHSSSTLNESFWHDLIAFRGPTWPTWATAVDDAHGPQHVDTGWSMVKAEAKSLHAILEALRRGSHYPTTGVTAEFGVDGDTIFVRTASAVHIEFLDGEGRVVHATVDAHAKYTPRGDEGFVRLRLTAPETGKRAWSQPFWLQEV